MLQEIKNLKGKGYEDLEVLQAELNTKIQALQAKLNLPSTLKIPQKFNFFEKHLFRRNEYKASCQYEEERNNDSAEIGKLTKGLQLVGSQLSDRKKENEQIQSANSIQQLGLSFEQAIDLLKSQNIPIVLTEDDKINFIKSSSHGSDVSASEIPDMLDSNFSENLNSQIVDYSGMEDFVLIHKTDFPPKDSEITSLKDLGPILEDSVTIDGTEYPFNYSWGRETVHFSVNHEVVKNDGGDWDDKKYACLIPFSDVPKDQIGQASPVDTFTKGGVALGKTSWILCPKGESSQIQKDNPNINVVEYEGDNALNYANVLSTHLGYNFEPGNNVNFDRESSDTKFKELMADEGLTCDSHSGTKEDMEEEYALAINYLASLSKALIDNGAIKNPQDCELMARKIAEIESRKGCLATYTNSYMQSIKSGMCEEVFQENGIIPSEDVKTTASIFPRFLY